MIPWSRARVARLSDLEKMRRQARSRAGDSLLALDLPVEAADAIEPSRLVQEKQGGPMAGSLARRSDSNMRCLPHRSTFKEGSAIGVLDEPDLVLA